MAFTSTEKKNLGIPTGKSPMKRKQTFQIGSVIDEFSAVNNSILVNDGDPTMLGTAIPYLYNLYSDLIVNPSSVSVSEFQKMVYTQPVIAATLTMLGNLVKNQLGQYNHENKTYKDYVTKMFNQMSRTMEELVTDILTFLWAGFYVGEKKYVSDGRFIYIKDIEPRPAQSILFRVDSQGHIKEDGIIQYYFNNLWTGYGNLLAFNSVNPTTGQTQPNPYASRGDFDYPWRTVWAQPIGTVIIPREKCVHIAYKGLDGLDNPYGRSLLRSAYDPYLIRSELNRITRNAANFKAAPTPIIVVDPDQYPTDSGEEAMQNMYNMFATLGQTGKDNPFGMLAGRLNESVWLSSLDTTANLNDFVNLNKYYDGQMLLSNLFQSDLLGLSDKGSYALGETQHDLVGRNIDAICKQIQKAIIEGVVKPMLEVNFEEKENFGAFYRLDNVAEDVALNMDKINTCINNGIKLKGESIIELLDLNKEMVESFDAPIIDQSIQQQNNNGIAANFRRAN